MDETDCARPGRAGRIEALKEEVCRANLRLAEAGLVTLTWGNASGYDPELGLVAIKPSGVPYGGMGPDDMVLLTLDGEPAGGRPLRPSSDTPTHLELYRHFPGVRGVVHTHSAEATAWAQACRAIPCYGTTHADLFRGEVPVTRFLTEREVAEGYERNTGAVIVEAFRGRDPLERPGVLVAGHAPFVWGASPGAAADNAVALEAVARMARLTEALGGRAQLPGHVAAKHYARKHGAGAYYGQRPRPGDGTAV